MAAPHLFLTLDPGVCGDDLVADIPVLGDDAQPIDTSAVQTAEFGMRHEGSGQRTPAYTLAGGGVAVQDVGTATFRCTVPRADSAALRRGWWRWQLRVTEATGRTTTALGRRQLLESVLA
jgi:hypothetical protein